MDNKAVAIRGSVTAVTVALLACGAASPPRAFRLCGNSGLVTADGATTSVLIYTREIAAVTLRFPLLTRELDGLKI